MRKLLPKVSNVFARYPSFQSCGNILLPFLGKPHLKIHLILLFFLYQKKESSKWRKWKYHYILEESKKDQSICVPFPNILGYIPKHRKQFEMDPNIIPSQIPTWVNKIKVSCLREKREGKYWHCQEGGRILTLAKKCGYDKSLTGRVILKMASENFWPAINPPKSGHNMANGTIGPKMRFGHNFWLEVILVLSNFPSFATNWNTCPGTKGRIQLLTTVLHFSRQGVN